MSKVSKAVVEAGLVDADVLREMRRWGVPLPEAEPLTVLRTEKDVVEHVRAAIESEDQVRIEETELDLLSRYLDSKHQKKGRLILKDADDYKVVKVTFCTTLLGEYAIPWTEDEESPDILANGQTHLKWENEDGERVDVYFTSVREVSFGARKAFAVCEVARA